MRDILREPCCHGKYLKESCPKCDELYTCLGAKYDLECAIKFLNRRIKELTRKGTKDMTQKEGE